MRIFISEEVIDHSRTVYSFLDLFGDFGGLLEVLSLTAAFFIAPLADFSLLVASLESLFRAKNLKIGKGKIKKATTSIKFNCGEFVKAFIHNQFNIFSCCCVCFGGPK